MIKGALLAIRVLLPRLQKVAARSPGLQKVAARSPGLQSLAHTPRDFLPSDRLSHFCDVNEQTTPSTASYNDRPGCAALSKLRGDTNIGTYFQFIDYLNDYKSKSRLGADTLRPGVALLWILYLDQAMLRSSTFRECLHFGTYFQVVDEVGAI